jgi:hypothetical protein
MDVKQTLSRSGGQQGGTCTYHSLPKTNPRSQDVMVAFLLSKVD